MSAERALEDLKLASIKSYTVGTACTKGKAVKLSADDTITDCSAGEDGIGVALETQTTGKRAQIVLLAGAPTIKVLVGTGDATRGSYGVVVSDGFTNVATLGGGTVAKKVLVKFLQSGVAGDYVGAVPAPFIGVSA